MSPSQPSTAADQQTTDAEPVNTFEHHNKKLPTPTKIVLLYASQTGQAESISEFIHSQFTASSGVLKPIEERLSSPVERHCLGKYESDLLSQFLQPSDKNNLSAGSYLAIIVASTTGQGDPPDTANKFFRWIRRLKRAQKPPTDSSELPLSHLSYALLGLGDTNYDNFANFGHLLDRHLTDLGAVQYVDAEYADDAVGLELVTEPFIENLTQTLLKHFGIEPKTTINKTLTTSWKQAPKTSDKENSEDKVSTKSDLSETESSLKPVITDDSKLPVETEPKTTKSDTQRDTVVMDTTKANSFEFPVVSSCSTLQDTEKNHLLDLHRQLIEPASSLKEVKTEDLVLPKIVNVEEERELNRLYKDTSNIESTNVKLVSVADFLKSKLPLDTVLSEGSVKMTGHLSTPSKKNLCVHQEKTVIECSVDFKLPLQSETSEPVSDLLPSFTPGDAFGIYSSNVLADVYTVLTRTFVYDGDETKENSSTTLWNYLASLNTSDKKKVYIKLSDKKSIVELLPHLFYGVDLRTIAKKAFLAHLAQFTFNSTQRRRLLELSSRQGANDYQALVFVHRLTLVDIVRTFTSCTPPLSLLLYYLMSAKPRYYSAASLPKRINSGQTDEKESERLAQFMILLSVTTDYTHSFARSSAQVLGLFSGKFFQHFPASESVSSYLPSDLACTDVWKSLEAVNAAGSKTEHNSDVPLLPVNSPVSTFPVYLFTRSIKSFRITDDLTVPLILICAGTGIAPFLSLLERRQQQMAQNTSAVSPGELFLFFGSRHPFQDCTYARRLIQLAKTTTVISHLCLCFSRASSEAVAKFEADFEWKLCKGQDEALPKHVNQLVTVHGDRLVKLINSQNAHTYICGDWKKLSPTLAKTFSRLFSEHYLAEPEPSDSSPEATKYLKELQKSGRYAVDIWS